MSENNRHITLAELSSRIRQVVQSSFSGEFYWVVAEVSGHKFYSDANRHYLDLVEKIEGQTVEAAKLKANVWSEGSKRITEFEKLTGQQFKDGLQVLVKVRVEYHIVYGLSVVISDIDASFTLGNLEKQRLQTLMRLVNENGDKVKQLGNEYITANKQLSLNRVLQKIALVASPNSEGFHDFMSNITRNQFGYTFHIDQYFTSVQGLPAAEELKNTMVKIYQSGVDYDCVVIIRGGGAKTDFLVFDSYGIAQAVARFPFPVITGIGHLRDISITDMMAHTVTNAPTKAAEFIVAHNRKFEDEIVQLQRLVVIKVQQFTVAVQRNLNTLHSRTVNLARSRLAERKDQLQTLKQIMAEKTRDLLFSRNSQVTFIYSKISASVPYLTAKNQYELQQIREKIRYSTNQLIKSQQEFMLHQQSLVQMMSPKNILKKGFALVKLNGKIKTKAAQINKGEELIITFTDGEIKTIVKDKINNNDGEYEL